MKTLTKARLAIILSKLAVFDEPQAKLEQYPTPSEIGADVLWQAYMIGDIENKSVVDLGCGSGILGLGAAMLGATPLLLLDRDEKALSLVHNNLSKLKSEGLLVDSKPIEIRHGFIEDLKAQTDVVIMNPPFGTRTVHADRIFVEKAMECASVLYSFHKSETLPYLRLFFAQKGWLISREWQFKFPLKATMAHHRRKIHYIDVCCIRAIKQ